MVVNPARQAKTARIVVLGIVVADGDTGSGRNEVDEVDEGDEGAEGDGPTVDVVEGADVDEAGYHAAACSGVAHGSRDGASISVCSTIVNAAGPPLGGVRSSVSPHAAQKRWPSGMSLPQ